VAKHLRQGKHTATVVKNLRGRDGPKTYAGAHRQYRLFSQSPWA